METWTFKTIAKNEEQAGAGGAGQQGADIGVSLSMPTIAGARNFARTLCPPKTMKARVVWVVVVVVLALTLGLGLGLGLKSSSSDPSPPASPAPPAAPPASPPPSPHLPYGWHDGLHIVWASDVGTPSGMDWMQARTACQGLGGELAALRSYEAHEAALALLLTRGGVNGTLPDEGDGVASDRAAWIGGTTDGGHIGWAWSTAAATHAMPVDNSGTGGLFGAWFAGIPNSQTCSSYAVACCTDLQPDYKRGAGDNHSVKTNVTGAWRARACSQPRAHAICMGGTPSAASAADAQTIAASRAAYREALLASEQSYDA